MARHAYLTSIVCFDLLRVRMEGLNMLYLGCSIHFFPLQGF